MNGTHPAFIAFVILSASSSLLIACESPRKSVLNTACEQFIDTYKSRSYCMYQNIFEKTYGTEDAEVLYLFLDCAQTAHDIEAYRIVCTWPLESNKRAQALSHITKWYDQNKQALEKRRIACTSSQGLKAHDCSNNHRIPRTESL
jgi:hypothetical protein